jgi:hypothetical protein
MSFRSKLGNAVTSLIFGLFTGDRLGDTQTGPRYIPRDKAAFLIRIPYDRFENDRNRRISQVVYITSDTKNMRLRKKLLCKFVKIMYI